MDGYFNENGRYIPGGDQYKKYREIKLREKYPDPMDEMRVQLTGTDAEKADYAAYLADVMRIADERFGEG